MSYIEAVLHLIVLISMCMSVAKLCRQVVVFIRNYSNGPTASKIGATYPITTYSRLNPFAEYRQHTLTEGLTIHWEMALMSLTWVACAVIAQRCMTLDVVFATTLWILLWFACHQLQYQGHNMTLGFLVLCMLGIKLGLLTDLSRYSPPYRWLVYYGCELALLGGIVLASNRLRDRLLVWFESPSGARLLLILAILTIAVAMLLPSSSKLYRWLRMPTWALAHATFIFGLALMTARFARYRIRTYNLTSFIKRWHPCLLLVAAPALSLLIARDFSPPVVFITLLVIAFIFTGETTAAIALGVLSIGWVIVAYLAGVPEVLRQRVEMTLFPSRGGSAHLQEILWALGRGGAFGRGIGHIAVVQGKTGFHPIVPLASTDSIIASLGESVGLIGFLAVLCLTMALGLHLLMRSLHYKHAFVRAFMLIVATGYLVTTVWCFAWHVAWVIPLKFVRIPIPMAGLAVPLLSRGVWAGALWALLMGLCVGWEMRPIVNILDDAILARVKLSNIKCLCMVIGVVVAITTVTIMHALRIQVFRRESILMERMTEASQETRLRRAIDDGFIMVDSEGKLTVNLNAPVAKAWSKSKLERKRKWAERMISGNYITVIRDIATNKWRIKVNAHAFIRAEPTIGWALHARRRWQQWRAVH